MTLRHDLAQYAADVASNPKTAAGFILAVMLIRKAMLENRKLKIEIDNLRGNKDG